MSDKIRLGTVKQNIESSQSYDPEKDSLLILGEDLFISKHSFDCGWYWGFGYIGNKNIHTHAETFIHELLWHDVNQVFEKSIFKNNNDFWVFKDLLKQAYALKECAAIYQYGGHCITDPKTQIIRSKEKAETINKDLEKILNSLWDMLTELSKKRQKKPTQ